MCIRDRLRLERVDELLAMGRTEMWNEFLTHRTFVGAGVSMNKKLGRFVVKDTTRRLSYPDLNDRFIENETKRMEEAGELVPEDLTIALDPKFNTYAPLFLRDCYLAFKKHNTSGMVANFQTKVKGGNVSTKEAPSMRQLEKDFNDLVKLLLPLEIKMIKADVRTIGMAMNKVGADRMMEANCETGLNWILNAIETRRQNAAYIFEVSSETGLETVREATEK